MNLKRFIDYQPVDRSSAFQPLILGFAAGILTWLLMLLLDRFILDPLLCTYVTQYCSTSSVVALVISAIAAHFIALIALVRTGALRPLLVILAVLATLWGFNQWLSVMTWWQATLYSGLLSGLAYAYYAWINRLLSFPVALVLTILSIVGARLIFASF